jgi:hypothetical protein
MLALLLTLLGGSCHNRASNPGANGKQPSLSVNLKPEQIAPFAKHELPNIQGNHMHEQHFVRGVHCGDCHPTNQPMPLQDAHKVCQNCHAERKVAKPVWLNHCLSCHHFTKISQEYETDAKKMVEHLCSKCHSGDGLGGSIYMLSGHQTSEMVKCDHCHRPHESSAPAAAELCVTCHKELAGITHPGGGKAECSICHGAHKPPPEGAKLCTTCHGQAENVLVHKIPNHPKDCLKCHNAHFTAIKIKGVCGDCHEGMVYRGGVNQPSGHLDCEHCHTLNNFKFKGNQVCGSCHKKEGAVRSDKRAPAKHKNCTTCHAPHTWRASYSRNCVLCHKTSDTWEHQLEYHKADDCRKCHDPHKPSEVPKSGSCAACHSDVPSFGGNAPEMHRQCGNCHPGAKERNFAIASWADSCQVCHTQAQADPPLEWSAAPSGHQDCSVCHQAHSMQQVGVESSCAVCHADIAAQAPNEMHGQCFNCHTQDHTVAFTGVDGSCKACHGEPPGTHATPGHGDCLTCHNKHSFSVDKTVCTVCHSDKQEGHNPGQACLDCHKFEE